MLFENTVIKCYEKTEINLRNVKEFINLIKEKSKHYFNQHFNKIKYNKKFF